MNYGSINNKLNDIRLSRTPIIDGFGGWHLSYFGNADFIINKLKNFSHQEFNTDYYLNKERIENVISNNKDLFDRKNEEPKKIKLCDIKNLPNNYKILLTIEE